MLKKLIFCTLAASLTAGSAFADSCRNLQALGISRVLEVDPAHTPRVGRKSFPSTLNLQDKEVVLTFDDGPNPGTTPRVLSALKNECVHATFFMVGRMAEAAPALARRVMQDGHTVAYHTYDHAQLDRISHARAVATIDRGFSAIDKAVYGHGAAVPVTPFFRFPGFASTPQLLKDLEARGIAVFGADLWASDWNMMTPQHELNLIVSRLDAKRRGIILFHDTRAETAAMLPQFLDALKKRGYRVVHIVPPRATLRSAL